MLKEVITLFLCLLGWEHRSAPPALKWLFGALLVWVWQSGVVKKTKIEKRHAVICPEGSTSPTGCTQLHFPMSSNLTPVLIWFFFADVEKWKGLERTGHVLIVRFP